MLETEQECVAGGRPPSAAWHTAAAAAQPHPGVPGPGAPAWRLGGAYNPAQPPGRRAVRLAAVPRVINQWRRHTLGLPPAPLLGPDRAPRRRRAPVLYGYSRWVVPKPPDWGQHLHVTGYWFLDHDPVWEPSAALARFLNAGPPPGYVGFGSMTDREAVALAQLTVAALRPGRLPGDAVAGLGRPAGHR